MRRKTTHGSRRCFDVELQRGMLERISELRSIRYFARRHGASIANHSFQTRVWYEARFIITDTTT